MEGIKELKRKSPTTSNAPSTMAQDDGFTKVQKRKQRKLDRHRPQFQYDTSYFRSGKKIGIAVSCCV
jgi:RNA exonuclease 1